MYRPPLWLSFPAGYGLGAVSATDLLPLVVDLPPVPDAFIAPALVTGLAVAFGAGQMIEKRRKGRAAPAAMPPGDAKAPTGNTAKLPARLRAAAQRLDAPPSAPAAAVPEPAAEPPAPPVAAKPAFADLVARSAAAPEAPPAAPSEPASAPAEAPVVFKPRAVRDDAAARPAAEVPPAPKAPTPAAPPPAKQTPAAAAPTAPSSGPKKEPKIVCNLGPVLRLPQRRPAKLWLDAGLALSSAVVPGEALAAAGLPEKHLLRFERAWLRRALQLRGGLGDSHPAQALLVPTSVRTLDDPETRDALARHCAANAGLPTALCPVMPLKDLAALRGRPAWMGHEGIEVALKLDGGPLPTPDLVLRAGVKTLVVEARTLVAEARRDDGPLHRLLAAFDAAGGAMLAVGIETEKMLLDVLDFPITEGMGACLATKGAMRFAETPLEATA